MKTLMNKIKQTLAVQGPFFAKPNSGASCTFLTSNQSTEGAGSRVLHLIHIICQ